MCYFFISGVWGWRVWVCVDDGVGDGDLRGSKLSKEL